MRAVGRAAPVETRLYFTGGATAVLLGWRSTTVDVDIRFFPETDQVFRAVPRLKEDLKINIELVSPSDFIPELPGWRERSLFVTHEGRISFYHYDPYSQALAKIERHHSQDLTDVEALGRGGWIEPETLMRLFAAIESKLIRYPAIDPRSFRQAVVRVADSLKQRGRQTRTDQ
ncbi:MAG: hypothetical protein OXH11_06665 [Candidatus Aminicenantes bacterium]|nr:hypothetical protein [Candidatus Aminicenantes bacterium]